MLSEEHYLSDQIMSIFKIEERNTQGPMKDLYAGSLETILQLVSMGFRFYFYTRFNYLLWKSKYRRGYYKESRYASGKENY